MRTFIWFCYFLGFLLLKLPVMYKGLRAVRKGDYETADEISRKILPGFCNKLFKLAGVEVTVTGAENIPDCPCVFTANHRSLCDALIMLTCFGKPMPVIAKIETEKIPFVRQWMRILHCQFLDRTSPRQGLEVINASAELIEKGYSIGIFPEGTRYKGNEGEMGPFLSGAFRIARKTGAPVVPVAIFNSRATLECDGHYTVKSAKVQVHILPAIETKAISRAELKELPEQVRNIILEELHKGMN